MNVGSILIVGLGLMAFIALVGLYLALTADPPRVDGKGGDARFPSTSRTLRIVPDERPRPVFDVRTGRLTHDDQCWGDDGAPDLCRCGLDDAEAEALIRSIEFGRGVEYPHQ